MAADHKPLTPPVTIAEEYLAAIVTELRGLRADLDELRTQLVPPLASTTEDGEERLIEPARPAGKRKRGHDDSNLRPNNADRQGSADGSRS